MFSYTALARYMSCPRSYRYKYIERWRKKQESANLVFGRVIHTAIERSLLLGERADENFLKDWKHLFESGKELEFSGRDTWDTLAEVGYNLTATFEETEKKRFVKVFYVEAPRATQVDTTNVIGILDLIADVVNDDGEVVRAVVDIKTGSREYSPIQVALSDQLTLYHHLAATTHHHLVGNQDLKAAFMLLVKQKVPKIRWYWTERTEEQKNELFGKIRWVLEQIYKEQFPRNPGLQCSWCDFAPLCLKDEKAIEETLVRAEKNETEAYEDVEE